MAPATGIPLTGSMHAPVPVPRSIGYVQLFLSSGDNYVNGAEISAKAGIWLL